ncbi:Protein CBG02018 [Caenorhabditis briggsae]|uniref:Uncharacterized protein n=2 Tax=Caenorhabditis briggsae TaxID=6238 RepID=A0AAE8ZMH5_CAEBR|nr:Protein CBG02018 [Caenorhabditis briggsae]ULT80553.1 hypothetical protein L3Y34_010850 [Caenorhabditis briggsae]CAP23195.1 Protein CBG02018 [Caenorhabditis briggsae]
MSKVLAVLFFLFIFSESIPTRFRRQYGWGVSPYYNAAQYYENQPQQWSSSQTNNQNYYSPYFYGYQRQNNWQQQNQNSYQQPQSHYNRPSWISEDGYANNGYATAPPAYNQANSGYGRPKYLATLQPKPTLSPVILERSTLFVTPEPTIRPTEGGDRHPTFLERLGVATLPIVRTNSEEETLKSAEEALKAAEEELGNGELLPERSEGGEESEEMTTAIAPTSEETLGTETPVIEFTEPSVLEKDEVASSEFFASSTEEPSTTEARMETTQHTTEVPTTTTTSESITEKLTTTTVLSTEPTTEEVATTSTTTTVPSEPPTPKPVKNVKPVTLLAFQEVTNEITSNPANVTQPTADQSTTSVGDLNEIGEGSGAEDAAAENTTSSRPSTFSTGIVGLRAPPVPKSTETGLAVVEWTDSDNEVRKVLLTQ